MTTPFPDDREHASYDAEAVERFWRVLDWSDGVLEEFAAGSAASRAPSTSSGTRSTSPSPASAAGRRRRCRTPTRSRRGVLARGDLVRLLGGRPERARAGVLLVHGCPSRPGCASGRSAPAQASGPTRAPARSPVLRTRPCARRPIRARRCSRSSRAPTRRAPTRPAGTATGSLVSSWCPSSVGMSRRQRLTLVAADPRLRGRDDRRDDRQRRAARDRARPRRRAARRSSGSRTRTCSRSAR